MAYNHTPTLSAAAIEADRVTTARVRDTHNGSLVAPALFGKRSAASLLDHHGLIGPPSQPRAYPDILKPFHSLVLHYHDHPPPVATSSHPPLAICSSLIGTHPVSYISCSPLSLAFPPAGRPRCQPLAHKLNFSGRPPHFASHLLTANTSPHIASHLFRHSCR